MTSWLKFCMPLVLGAALLAAPAPSATAQSGDDALLVVSAQSIDDLLENLDYLLEVAGVEQYGTLARMSVAPFTEVIDKTMPMGAVALADEDDQIYPLVFLPADDINPLLDVLELVLQADIEEINDGVYQVDLNGETAFLKNQGDWVFVSNSEGALEYLPQNPEDYLSDLSQDYLVAVQGNVKNIPESYIDMAIGSIRAGMAGAMSQEPGESDEEYEFRINLIETQVEQIIEMIEQTDQITYGWAIDPEEGSIYTDFSITAVSGSALAQQLETLQGTTSNFAGFLLPDAAVTFNLSSTVSEEDAAQAADLYEGLLDRVLEEIEEESGLDSDEDRAAAQEIVRDLFGILADTVASGVVDGGGALMLGEESLTAVFGLHVADGSDVEDVLHQLDELAKDEPEYPGIVFDDDSHAGVSFHTMEIPIPDPDARRIFGNDLLVVIGTGEDSVYFAFGPDSIDVLEDVIDGSIENANEEVLPFQLNVAIAPIMDFAASVGEDANLIMVAGLLEGIRGRDHVSLALHPIEDGVTYRLEVEEGIIEAIGLAIRMFEEQAGGPGGPPPGGFDF